MIYHSPSGDENCDCDPHNLDGLEDDVRQTVENLRPYRKEFDSIVVTGMSGVIVGVPVSMRLKKPLVILRKDGDDSHHGGNLINAKRLGLRVLFLDDFVSGGTTRKKVEQAVHDHGSHLVVAQYEYRDHTWSTR